MFEKVCNSIIHVYTFVHVCLIFCFGVFFIITIVSMEMG